MLRLSIGRECFVFVFRVRSVAGMTSLRMSMMSVSHCTGLECIWQDKASARGVRDPDAHFQQ